MNYGAVNKMRGRTAVPTHISHSHTRSEVTLQSLINLTCMYLDSERKLEKRNKHTDTRKTCRLQAERPRLDSNPEPFS